MYKIPGSTLRSVFSEKYRIDITPTVVNNLIHWCINYELYKDHPNVLNTPYLGVGDMYFTESNQNDIFNIFGVDKRQFAKDITTISTVDINRKVTSDPLNLFIVWVAHLMFISNIPETLKQQGMITLFKIMHYKFFTSLLIHRFNFKSDLNVMIATIESLNNKFDIVKYGTWKKAMEARSEDIVSHGSIHYKTLLHFKEDKGIFYVISDTQSRLRDKINIINSKYRELKEKGQSVELYSTVGTDIEGKKVIKDTSGTLSIMVANISQDILSTNNFIDTTNIKILCGLNKELKPYMLQSLLIRFSEIAAYQNKKNKLDEIKKVNDVEIIIGHRKIVEEIIQTTYRNCITSGANMNNKHDILRVAGNIYRSSQIQDPNILRVKRSVEAFVKTFPGTARFNTQLALRINLILYIILLSFKYI